jgi:hypothetical protein
VAIPLSCPLRPRDDQDHGVGSLGCDWMYETFEEIPGALLVPPPVWPVNPAVTALLLLPSLFDVDYLTAEHAEIYVGRSRHWAVAWLWFLS